MTEEKPKDSEEKSTRTVPSSDESESAKQTEVSHQGGIQIGDITDSGGEITVSDLTGRDKLQAGGHIIQAAEGATVIIDSGQLGESTQAQAYQARREIRERFSNIEQGLQSLLQHHKQDVQSRHESQRSLVVNRSVRYDLRPTFRNRTQEINRLRTHLTNNHTRLIEIIGHGGMGKTALASYSLIEIERGLSNLPIEVRGLAYFSPSITGLTLERLYTDLGSLLGEPYKSSLIAFWQDVTKTVRQKAHYLLDQITNALPRDAIIIIFIDKLEQAIDDTGRIVDEGVNSWVEACIRAWGGVKLIVTTRSSWLFPEGADYYMYRLNLVDGLPDSDSLELLRTLGKGILQQVSDDSLLQLIKRAQGIPFALEKIVALLQRNPRLISTNFFDDELLFKRRITRILAKHSYSHLNDIGKKVLKVLSIYNRPVPTPAIALCLNSELDFEQLEAIMDELHRDFYVSYYARENSWSLHDEDKQIASAYLQQKDRQFLHARAADYYRRLRLPEDLWHSLTDVEPQLLEFEHRVNAGQYDDACDLLSTLDLQLPPRSSYFFQWGHVKRAKEMREKLILHLQDKHKQWTNYYQLGLAYTRLGQLPNAISAHEDSLTIAQQLNDKDKKGASLVYLGLVYYHLDQYERAIEHYEQALPLNQDGPLEGNNLGHLGNALSRLGRLEESINYLQKAIKRTKEHSDQRSEAFWLGRLGAVYRRSDRVNEALDHLIQALVIAQEIGDRQIEIFHLKSLASLHVQAGQHAEAINHYNQGITLAHDINDSWNEAGLSWELGLLYADTEPSRAVELMSKRILYEKKINNSGVEALIKQVATIETQIEPSE